MKAIKTVETEYVITANRTLETTEVTDEQGNTKTWWIYNYEGKHFRVFDSRETAETFLYGNGGHDVPSFNTEDEVDKFLQSH